MMTRSIQFRTIPMLFALLGTAALAGCASGGGGSSTSFRSDMGRLLQQPLAQTRAQVWGLHQIPLYREQLDPQRIVYESEWMPRRPTPAEESSGVTGARNQIVIRGRRVEEAMDMSSSGAVYRVTFEILNQVRTNLNAEWHSAPIPREAVDMYREVLTDMELELRTGMRR
jgi:hypothetical protein